MKKFLFMVLVMGLAGVAQSQAIPVPASSADSGARASIAITPVDLSNYVTNTQLGSAVTTINGKITNVDGRVTTVDGRVSTVDGRVTALNSNVVNNYATKALVTTTATNATNYTNTKYNSAVSYTNTKYNNAIAYTQDYATGRIVTGAVASTWTSAGLVYVRGVCVGGRSTPSSYSVACPSGSGFILTETELRDDSTGP